MRQTLCVVVGFFLLAGSALAAPRKVVKEQELKKKETSITPDKSLAGDVTRKVEKRENAPALKYDQFRLGIEVQVASKRREQIEDLKKIIELSSDKQERPKLLFRLGELYWEESKFFFFEANRKDDAKLEAMNRNDRAGIERAEAEKAELAEKSKEFAQYAVEQYTRIVQEFKDFERTDEVLYFLGLNLMEMGDERRAVPAYRRLIDKYQKSKYLPDSYLALGEYYFNNSKGKRDGVEKALVQYQSAAKFQESKVYGYALYKQGWCFFNLGQYEQAMDAYRSVILYAEFAGKEEVEGAGKSNRAGLVKEARNDYVRAYSRLVGGSPADARSRFGKIAKERDDLRLMMRNLAALYYEDGKDKEAALAYDMLIKERPTSPEAPGYQGRIVDCVMRAGNKRMTVQQVRRLVKIMDEVLKGNKTLSDKDKKALDEARDLSERTISNLAVNWHNEAKKTRDDETFNFANEVYADYLTLFPESSKAYDLRFFWAELLNDNLTKYDHAAEQYTLVMVTDVGRIENGTKDKTGKLEKPGKPGKWMNNAAYNAILAWGEVVKKAEADGKIKLEVAEPGKKLAIPAEKKALLEACERYLKYVDKGEKKVEIAYKAAKIYYDYNWLDEAVERFADIALTSPEHKFENGDKAGEIAANLVLDSYNLLGDWAKVNEWSRKFYAEPRLAAGKFREELAKLIEQSSFKLINQLEAKKDYAKAAEAYMTFVNEFPRSELADKALFNASIDFYNARMLDRAIEVRKQIIAKYPRSQHVPQSMFALAEGYEAIADFDKASDYYERYAAAYEDSKSGGGKKKARPAPRGKRGKKAPPSKPAAADGEQVWEEAKAQDALFNAGIFREGLGEFKQALKNREKYLALWPSSKDAESVTKTVIELYERMGNWKKALDGWEDYERAHLKDPNKVLMAEGRIATIFEVKLKKGKDTARLFGRILDYYEKLSRKQQESLEVTALDAVARARFAVSEGDWRAYSKLKLRWSSLAKIGELKASIAAKAKGLEEIQKVYTRTVKLKSADPAICALYKIGMAYDEFYEGLKNPPVPKGIPEDLLLEVKLQFEQEAQPISAKAAEAFASVVQRSQDLDVFNPCTSAALTMLREKYAPERFPKMPEEILELKLGSTPAPSTGQDVLTTIQAVPVVSAERAAQMSTKAAELGSDLADLGSKPPPDPSPGPAPRTAPRTGNNPDTEPEEPL